MSEAAQPILDEKTGALHEDLRSPVDVAVTPLPAQAKPARAKGVPKPPQVTPDDEERHPVPSIPGTDIPAHSLTTAAGRALMAYDPEKEKRKPKVHYSNELAISICMMMAQGYMLPEICSRDDMPAISTVMRWQLENPIFAYNMTQAREALGDRFAWQVKVIAENTTVFTAPSDRVKMDAYKWLAAKHYPRAYGDKSIVDLQANVTHEHRQVIDIRNLDPEDIANLERILTAAKALPSPQDPEVIDV